jgi:peptidoglycan/LPS O-acetylase OafA/YrhL
MHIPLVLFFENLATRVHGWPAKSAVLIFYVVVLVAVSGWTYRLIENPLRKTFNRLAAGSNMAAPSTIS